MTKSPTLPDALPLRTVMVVVCGFIGAELGSRRLSNPTIQKVLVPV
jgi:hypothetical protein